MKIQMAPLEGITTYIYRRAFFHHFEGVDLYYIPFISLSGGEKVFNHKEKAELVPENNKGMHVIPQVITNSAADVLAVQKKLTALGYEELNINLGCPSGTVVPKGRGAGMLRDPMKLDAFLYELFEKSNMRLSIKTRIGFESADEWADLLKIYNKYPVDELIIHARVRQDFYKNTPDLDAYALAVSESKNPICYNGDIFSASDYLSLKERFPQTNSVMLGRGLLANPFLPEQIKALSEGKTIKELENKYDLNRSPDNVKRLKAFHDEIYAEYKSILSGDRNLMFKMKEFWRYLSCIMPDSEKHDKKIKKITKSAEYECCIGSLFYSLGGENG